MKRYSVVAFGQPLAECTEPDPVPTGTEVVVDLQRCGVCHTDLHLHEGFYDLGGGKRLSMADRGVTPPVTMGHEILGRLAAAGPEAGVSPGDLGRTYVVYPWIGCGHCFRCVAGQENLCAAGNVLGVHRPGGYAEKVVVPHPRYLVDAEGLDPSVAATLACSGLTSYAALSKLTIDREADWLLLVGAGGVGQSAYRLARALGFRKVAVCDLSAEKREAARAGGADLVIDPTDPGAVGKLTGSPRGLGAAIDFVGNPATVGFALSALRRGGHLVIVGLFGGEFSLALPPVPMKAITIQGSYVGNLGELRDLVDLVRRSGIETVETETVPLAQADAALGRLRAGRASGRLVLGRELEPA